MKKILIINNEKERDDFGWIPIIKEAILNIGDYEFYVLHHTEINENIFASFKPDFIYLTGRVTYDWDLEEILQNYSQELKLIKDTTVPTIGVCAGHQLIAVAHGADFGKMVEVKQDEEDIREKGFTKVDIVKRNRIFDGLSDNFKVYQLHRDEVKTLPEDFELLASTEMCKIQAMKHKQKYLYSVQFHPEKYNEENIDGKIILENFLNIK